MKKRRQRDREKGGPQNTRSRATLVALCLVVTLAAGAAILGAGGGQWFAAKAVSPSLQGGDPLAPGNPSKEYVYVGGRLLATEEPPGSSGCGSPGIPSGLVATAEFTPNKVRLDWNPSSNAHHYEVQRRQNADPFSTINPNCTVTFLDDNFNLVNNTAYVYRVRAVDAQSICPSEYSPVDLATTTNFAETISSAVTIKAAHLLELATAVNAVRITAGFPLGFTWGSTPPPASGGSILKDQMQKLRNDLNQARGSLTLSQWSFSEDPLTPGVTVKALHVLQLRDAVK